MNSKVVMKQRFVGIERKFLGIKLWLVRIALKLTGINQSHAGITLRLGRIK